RPPGTWSASGGGDRGSRHTRPDQARRPGRRRRRADGPEAPALDPGREPPGRPGPDRRAVQPPGFQHRHAGGGADRGPGDLADHPHPPPTRSPAPPPAPPPPPPRPP